MKRPRGSYVSHFIASDEQQDLVDFIEHQQIILPYHREGEKTGLDGMMRWDAVNKRILISSEGKFRVVKTEEI